MRVPGTIKALDYWFEEGRVLPSECACIKHLFWCDETTGATSLTDAIGGVVMDNTSSPLVTQNADRTVSLSANFNRKTGDYTNPGTNKLSVIMPCKPTASGSWQMGTVLNTTSRGLLLTTTGLNKAAADAGVLVTEATAVTPALSGSTEATLTVQANWGGDLESYDMQSGLITANAESIATMTGIETLNSLAGNGLTATVNPGFILALHTTNAIPPALMKEIIAFTQHTFWTLGKKVLHPALRYL